MMGDHEIDKHEKRRRRLKKVVVVVVDIDHLNQSQVSLQRQVETKKNVTVPR